MTSPKPPPKEGASGSLLKDKPPQKFRKELDYYFNWHDKNPVEMPPFGFCEGGTIASKV